MNRDAYTQSMRFIVLFIIFSFLFLSSADADTLYLKNGRKCVGIITRDDAEFIEINVGGGTVKHRKELVDRIEKFTAEEVEFFKNDWLRRQEARKKMLLEKEFEPKKVSLMDSKGHVFVDTVVDGKTPAKLLLDTGASTVLLTKSLGEKLGLGPATAQDIIKIQVADGRKVDARFIHLSRLKVQDVEAQDVEAAILLEDLGGESMGDGLLGMSFLKRFSFEVDYPRKQLILKKLR